MDITIFPGKLKGTITAPPSKSYAHRTLICAALTEGTSNIEGIAVSEDIRATLDCISSLGSIFIYDSETGLAQVRGIQSSMQSDKKSGSVCNDPMQNLTQSKSQIPRKEFSDSWPVFPCRESGSTLRFMIPLALAVWGGGIFTGTQRLMERGIGVYEEIFAGQDIRIRKEEGKISVSGRLKAGHYRIRGDVSSQFVTGMLLALSLLKDDSVIEVLPPVESRAYIDITVDVMKRFGVEVKETSANVFHIPGGQKFRAGEYRVEGDWSNAAFLCAFNAIGGDLDIYGLRKDSIQGDIMCMDFLDLLIEWNQRTDNCQLENVGTDGSENAVARQSRCAGAADLRKMDDQSPAIDLSDTPDLGPVLFAAAAALGGGRFTGTRRLRIKESDRAQAMAEELLKFGVECTVFENEVIVPHTDLQKPSVPLNGHNDHRIIMALSVLASITGGTIEGAEAVNKSWPDFFTETEKAGLIISQCEKATASGSDGL